MSLQERFEKAKALIGDEANGKKFRAEASVEEQLEIYGYFKQGNGLDYSKASRGWGPESWKKYSAWGEVSNMPVEEAQEKYIEAAEKAKAKYDLKDPVPKKE